MTSRRNCIRTSLITHLLLQCAAVTTKSSLMRNPPHVWPPLFCTEAIYCIEFSGTFSPCMMSLPRTAKISKSQNQVNVLFNSSWMTTRFGFLTNLDACQKMEKQKCTQTVHDGSKSNLCSKWCQADPFILQLGFVGLINIILTSNHILCRNYVYMFVTCIIIFETSLFSGVSWF